MKKCWNNPELKDLSLVETKSDDCPYPEEGSTLSHVPIPDGNLNTPYNPFDRKTCTFYNGGCTNPCWKPNNPCKWPCSQANKKGSNA